MSAPSQSSFTFVEALVVGVIVALIVALLLPAVQLMREAAARARCANNLHNLGMAYIHRVNVQKEAFSGLEGWPSELTSFSERQTRLYHCLDDRRPEQQSKKIAAAVYVRQAKSSGYGGHTIPLDPSSPRCRESAVVEASEQARSHPGSWGLEIEEGNRWTFNDLRVLVYPNSDGNLTVQFFSKEAGYTFDLVDMSGNVLVSNMSQPGQSAVIPGNSSSSYGVNNRASVISGNDLHKVLLLEYQKPVAYQVGANATDNWPDVVAPRHRGRLNVLFPDGSVRALRPDDIDPRVPATYQQSWLPEADKP